MSEKDFDDFKEFLNTRLNIEKQDLEKILYFFSEQSSPNITCNFYLIQCTTEYDREKDFIKFILRYIIPYVLKRKEYLPENITKEAYLTKIRDIYIRAKRSFMTKNPITGEGGELILFLLLESEGIVQLLNKMNLKMNHEIPVLGLDAIHIQAKNGVIFLHYGESKMYKNFDEGMREAVNTLENFNDEKEEEDLNLVSSYIDNSKFDKYADKIIDLISPYKGNKENLSKANSVFIGYNWDVLSNCSEHKGRELGNYLKSEYIKSHKELFRKTKDRITKAKNTDGRSFNFYILPFKDIDEFRQNFLKELKK